MGVVLTINIETVTPVDTLIPEGESRHKTERRAPALVKTCYTCGLVILSAPN